MEQDLHLGIPQVAKERPTDPIARGPPMSSIPPVPKRLVRWRRLGCHHQASWRPSSSRVEMDPIGTESGFLEDANHTRRLVFGNDLSLPRPPRSSRPGPPSRAVAQDSNPRQPRVSIRAIRHSRSHRPWTRPWRLTQELGNRNPRRRQMIPACHAKVGLHHVRPMADLERLTR